MESEVDVVAIAYILMNNVGRCGIVKPRKIEDKGRLMGRME